MSAYEETIGMFAIFIKNAFRVKIVNSFNRSWLVENINCTLSHFDWIMEGLDPTLPMCENNTKSFEVIKVRIEHFVNKLRNGHARALHK